MKDSPNPRDYSDYRDFIKEYRQKHPELNERVLNIVLDAPRDSVSVRINKTYHEAFGYYCRLANMTLGEFYEQAGFLFMKLYPVEGITIIDKEEDL